MFSQSFSFRDSILETLENNGNENLKNEHKLDICNDFQDLKAKDASTKKNSSSCDIFENELILEDSQTDLILNEVIDNCVIADFNTTFFAQNMSFTQDICELDNVQQNTNIRNNLTSNTIKESSTRSNRKEDSKVTDAPSCIKDSVEEISLGLQNVSFTEDFPKQSVTNNSENAENISVKKFEQDENKLCEQNFSSIENTEKSSQNVSKELSSSFTTSKPDSKYETLSENDLPNINIKKYSCLQNWGLPNSIVNEYFNKGIRRLFQWQVECLTHKNILIANKNLVYSAPTSAGKTLVSEFLMIKNVVERKKKALIILPFISVAREKMFYLQDLLSPSKICVEGFFGGYSTPKSFENIDIGVCTIEKANSIINRLLEHNKLEIIGCLVVDEIHLISDASRGYILELLLAKVIFVCNKFEYQIQIIGMSATLPNANLLAKWLQAELFTTTFRPVKLCEMIKISDKIYDNKVQLIRSLNLKENVEFPKDQDHIGQLCFETIMDGGSIIIFCPTKDWCESLSIHIASFIYSLGKSKCDKSNIIRTQIDVIKMEEIKSQLRNCATGLDSVLENTLSYACAYHHAGLTSDEREIIENGFKIGVIKVIAATSTLSSGVNLPARRVIIRTPMFGGKILNSTVYKQMIGRAGRTGQDPHGESILICDERNKNSAIELISAGLKPLVSCLDVDNNVHMKRAILEIIASGVASTKTDLQCFLKCTLLYCDRNIDFDWDNDIFKNASKINGTNKNEKAESSNSNSVNLEENPIVEIIQFLLTYEFIRVQFNSECNDNHFISTRLGNACLASSMPPEDGFLLFSELQKSRQCFVLESDLHAIYLVTPYSVCYQVHDIDWVMFLDLWEKLPTHMRRVGELVGVRESFLIKAMRSQKLDYKTLQIHKRFYTALALQELVNECPLTQVAAKFKCSRGLLQTLQQLASTFAGIVMSFCVALNWTMLGTIISEFQQRLFFGVHKDLCDLMRISILNSHIARALHKNDIKTLIDLANSNVFTIETILHNITCFDSNKRNGDNNLDADKRYALRHLYIPGKTGLTIQQTALLIIEDARRYLENELGLKKVNWSQSGSKKQISEISFSNETSDVLKKDLTLSPNLLQENSKTNPNKNEDIVNTTELRIDCRQLIDITRINNIRPDNHLKENSISISKEIRRSSNSIYLTNVSTQKNNTFNMDCTKILEKSSAYLSMLNIINVFGSKILFEKFQEYLPTQNEIGLSIGIRNYQTSKMLIGENLFHSKTNGPNQNVYNCTFDDELYIKGISLYLTDSNCYFLNLQNDNTCSSIKFKDKLNFVKRIFDYSNITLHVFHAKEQLKIIKKIVPLLEKVNNRLKDPKIADWLIQPEIENCLVKMAEQYAPECVEMVKFGGFGDVNHSIGMNHKSTISVKVRSSIESCIVVHIIKGQIEHLNRIGNVNIVKTFEEMEMPIQNALFLMEIKGFPCDRDELIKVCQNIENTLKEIETKLYEYHGRKFNIASSKEVAKVLGMHQNNMKNKKTSTSKEVLAKIDHPISSLIIQYRKLSTILSKNMRPFLNVTVNNRIHSNSISFTATGRISMHEPSLQNVAKNFEVNIGTQHKTISCRDVFKTYSHRSFLSADFCQLELRILSHLSQDSELLKIMKSQRDVFKEIAGKWNKVSESEVTDEQRNEAKHVCYGIIYGMGIKSLSNVLHCTEQEAYNLNESFHRAFPGIRCYIDTILKYARHEGYVETLSGRRRYISHINNEDYFLRSQAERQAINTTVQGSAADVAKYAILRMERNLKKYEQKLKINQSGQDGTFVDFILHLHDELVYECPSDKTKQIAKILKSSMENCAKLCIPLQVKIKSGMSWGKMETLNL